MPSSRDNQQAAAIGFRVKSGWAAAVLLAGSSGLPLVVDHGRIELSDPGVPQSRQPYHAGFGLAQTDSATVARLVRLVQSRTRQSMADLIDRFQSHAERLLGAGLVVGSNISPERIANPHVRAHADEGRLFRNVVERETRRHGLACWIILERDLYATAAGVLRRTEKQLNQTIAGLGRGLAGPWRAEQKAAALAAWIVLANHPRHQISAGQER